MEMDSNKWIQRESTKNHPIFQIKRKEKSVEDKIQINNGFCCCYFSQILHSIVGCLRTKTIRDSCKITYSDFDPAENSLGVIIMNQISHFSVFRIN